MKKIILSLFLLLGVLSFTAPSYVDVNRIKKDGYDIDVNDSDTLAFTQKGSDMNLIVTMYFTNDGNPQNLRAAFKSIFAPQFRLKYIDEFETNRAYIQKSTRNNPDGTVSGYNIIAKNQKKLLYKCFSYLNARISR